MPEVYNRRPAPAAYNAGWLSQELGNIARAVPWPAGGVFNVQDRPYGAAGNGTRDDSAAFQRAIDAAQAAGGSVFIPTGRYKITTRLDITAPLGIFGAGWGAELVLEADVIALYVADAVTQIAGFTARDFAIDGNGNGQPDAGLIQINGCGGFLVDHLYLHDGGTPGEGGASGVNGVAVAVSGLGNPASEGSITNCLMERCTKAPINWTSEAINGYIAGNIIRDNTGNGQTPGLQVNGGFNGKVIGNSVSGNEGRGIIVASSGSGATARSPKYAIIANNHVYGNGTGSTVGDGIAVVNGTSARFGKIIVAGNVCYENGGTIAGSAGILVQNEDHVLVHGNTCHANYTHGIFVDGADYVQVKDNTCVANNTNGNAVGSGIILRDANHFTVSDNACYDDAGTPTQKYGVYFLGTVCDSGSVTNNTCYPNGTAGLGAGTAPTSTMFVNNQSAASDQWAMGTTVAQSDLRLVGGALLLKDGITAPSATSGYATQYVDTADGDLKVKFGDGVTKTLAVDT